MKNTLPTIAEEGSQVEHTPSYLKAVILDNDETTGSYGIVFSVLTQLQKENTITNDDIRHIYNRLAEQMVYYNLFRPHLAMLMHALEFLKTEDYIDSVIMYTNQTESKPYNYRDNFKGLLYNVPYTISYLIYSATSLNIFNDVLSRPTFLRGIHHTICQKSFNRIFALDNKAIKDTRDILFVDDNASPKFITASSKTIVHKESFYKIEPYIKTLTSKELDSVLQTIFHGISIKETTIAKIKEQYRIYSPLSNIQHNSVADTELLTLKTVILEKYT